jgi:hypothetical protein
MFVLQLIQLLLVVQLGLVLALQMRSGATAEQQARPSSSEDSAYAPPSRAQQLWALGTCAILADINGQRHDLLGGSERTPAEIKRWRDCLAKWWGVRSRAELLETLRWLDEDGHRRAFNDLARALPQASAAQLDAIQKRCSEDPTFSNRVDIVRKYQKELGTKSILAWDYGRYVSLCGWGYVVGFLTADEAWRKIMPVASFLQDTFDSWDDLGRSYVIGREFWSPGKSPESRRSYANMLNNASSPWNRLPWSMDLKPGAKELDKTYDYVKHTYTNFVESSGRIIPELVPTTQWTWKSAPSNDADAFLVVTITGQTIPPANVKLPLKRCATQQGPAWHADKFVLLDTAPWDSVCKGGRRTVSFVGVSIDGIDLNINQTWGPASLKLLDSTMASVTGPGSDGQRMAVPSEFSSCATSGIRVPYTGASKGRTGDIFYSAKWLNKSANAPLSAEP